MKPLIPTLSIQVTYQCNIECKHCGPYCGPYETDWMTDEEIRHLVVQAKELGVRNVVFTGGEPSLLGKRLPPLLRFIRDEAGIPLIRIVTNAKWATSPERARTVLAEWQEAGLSELNISCGEYHQEFVPLTSVANAYRAGCDLGFTTVLVACELLAEGKGTWSRERFLREMYEAIGEEPMDMDLRSPFSLEFHGCSFGAAMCSGRGEHLISREDVVVTPYDQIASRCSEVLTAITAHPNGHMTACCGVMVREDSLLTIGNWREQSLREILERADSDVVLNWIRYLGLKDMREWLLRKDPSLKLRDTLTNICDLCQDLVFNEKCQKLLLAQGAERAADIIALRLAVDSVDNSTGDFQYAQPVGVSPDDKR